MQAGTRRQKCSPYLGELSDTGKYVYTGSPKEFRSFDGSTYFLNWTDT